MFTLGITQILVASITAVSICIGIFYLGYETGKSVHRSMAQAELVSILDMPRKSNAGEQLPPKVVYFTPTGDYIVKSKNHTQLRGQK